MDQTINLRDIVNTIRKRIGLIMLVTILAIIITAIISYFVLSPIYETSTEILVNQNPEETGEMTNEDIQINLQLIKTYIGILRNPIILDKVVYELDLGISTGQLNEKISVSNTEQSQLITISVRDESPERAVEIANTTARIFENDIQELMNVNNIRILSPAVLSENPVPVSPNPPLNMAIAAVLGFLFGVAVVLLLEHFKTIKEEEK